jgi:Ca2+ transporting ATPase
MEDAEHAHARDAEEVARSLSVQMESGLSSGEAARRRAAYGANAMPAEEPTPLWRLLLRQLDDPLVKILLCSAAVSFASAASQGQHLSTSLLEPSVILSILAANAAVGVATESSAHSSLSSLQRLQPDRATALRNSHPTVVPASDLVPGDVISLSVGDRVPADCRLASVASRELCCDQALLTGESASVRKSPEPIDTSSGDLLVQDKHNILFSGTTITRGRARCIIIATGSHTAIGRIR